MVLRKCSVKAISLCPDAKICCTQRHPAEFAEGSECHKFNEEVESLYTNADYIRSMSDEELADLLYNFGMSNIVERGKTEIAMRADKYHIELWLRKLYKENTDE